MVFRALAGLDSLAQAAGRCNREGRQALGDVHLFVAPTQPPPGILSQGLDTLRAMLAANADLDLLSPATMHRYSRMLFAKVEVDRKQIQLARKELQFRVVAERFQMIPEGQVGIVVPFDRAAERAIADLRHSGPSRQRMRAVQRFIVQVHAQAAQALANVGAIEYLHDQTPVLCDPKLYSARTGLRERDLPAGRDPGSLFL